MKRRYRYLVAQCSHVPDKVVNGVMLFRTEENYSIRTFDQLLTMAEQLEDNAAIYRLLPHRPPERVYWVNVGEQQCYIEDTFGNLVEG